MHHTINRVTVGEADTEIQMGLPDGLMGLVVQNRSNTPLRIAFAADEIDAGGGYEVPEDGYRMNNLGGINGAVMYYSSPIVGTTLEVFVFYQ